MNQGWVDLDGNGHYWPAQPPMMPPSFYATPADPLVSADFNGWWARGFALVEKVWKPAAVLHAAVAVPSLALSIPTQRYMERQQAVLEAAIRARPTEFPFADYLVAMLLAFAVGLVTGALFLIAASATVQLVVLAATGRPVSLGAALGTAVRRAHALLGWGLLALLISAGALMLCIVPIFYVGAVLVILPVVVTVERGVGVGRCFQLFHADFGASAARIGTLLGLGLATALTVSAVLATARAAGGVGGVAVEVVVNGLYYVVMGVVGVPLLVTTYADMRSRREPFSTAYLMPAPKA